MLENKKLLAFIGSYANSNEPGIYACRYDAQSGSLELIHQTGGLQNPTFVSVDVEHKKLYAIAEGEDAHHGRCGMAVAFDIEPETGTLTLLNEQVTVPATTCHLSLDRSHRCIAVSSYHGGMIGISPVLEDGRVGVVSDIHRHQGSSVAPAQDRARAHSVFFDRSNRFAIVCDLGLDRIFTYRLDASACRLLPHKEMETAPGAGPRHFAFHPTFAYGYAINELNATITAYAYDEEQGALSEIQTVPTLPDSYVGVNSCADIHISPDGKFLYGSNRGHDSIVVYAIDPLNGLLAFVEHVSTLGEHPRNFAISPDGHFVLVANRDTNNIVTFSRDAQTGKLLPVGSELHVSKPVCIQFAAFE